jgi:L-amino acid N-acyltransferase YncA
MPVREAMPKDFDSILDMCEVFWKHTQFDEPLDREHTRNMVQMSYDHELLIVAEDEGIIEGFMAAIKSPLLGTPAALAATELAWWINPDSRGRMYGVQLLQLLERLCIEQDVKYLNLAFMETSMPDKVKHLYKSLGYKLQETLYTKVLYGSGNRGGDSGSGGSRISR